MQIAINAPINPLSFGNVSFNIIRELFNRKVEIALFPIGNEVELSAFDSASPELIEYIRHSVNNRYKILAKDLPCLKLWHINGCEQRYTKNQTLFTFHETSEITDLERRLLLCQDNIIVTSNYTKEVFESAGINNVNFIPLGFDADFKKTNKVYFNDDRIHWGLCGKMEYRKNTARIIKTWLKLYGNKKGHLLSCAIHNSFLPAAAFQNEMLRVLEGKQYNNINLLPHMRCNGEVNDYVNSLDVELAGLSGSEGWGLPAFQATALGKNCPVINATAHCDWATDKNCVLIEPSGRKVAHDGIFFQKGAEFNQGFFYDISDQEIEESLLKTEKIAKTVNTEGLKLQSEFTYAKTVNKIMEVLRK